MGPIHYDHSRPLPHSCASFRSIIRKASSLEHKNPYNSVRRKEMHSVQGVYVRESGRGRYRRVMFCGFEAVATDGAVGSSQVAGVSRGWSREPKAAETYLGSCGPVVVLTASRGRETLEIPESVEGLGKFLGVGQDGDEVGLEAGARGLAGPVRAIPCLFGGSGHWPRVRELFGIRSATRRQSLLRPSFTLPNHASWNNGLSLTILERL